MSTPKPPEGHATWLDYAIATMDTRSLNIESLFFDGEEVTRESMRAAAAGELERLRATTIICPDCGLLVSALYVKEQGCPGCHEDEQADEIERLNTWNGLISLLDKHYPADIFDGSSGDPGPRTVALIREIGRLKGASQ